MRRCLSIIIRNDGQLYMMFKFERNDGLIENKRTTTSDEDNESEIKIINSFYQTGDDTCSLIGKIDEQRKKNIKRRLYK